MSEYSPRVTGIQPVEDLLPLLEHNPRRFRLIANLNPHLHHPITDELERQLALGAAAVKLHPVHGGFSPTEGVLYLVYQRCAELGVPVVFHTGTSTFPGATVSSAANSSTMPVTTSSTAKRRWAQRVTTNPAIPVSSSANPVRTRRPDTM